MAGYLAVCLHRALVKRIAAGDQDLTPAERFVAVMTVLDGELENDTPENVTVSRAQYLVMRDLANTIMLDAARDVLAAPPPSETKH